MLNPNCDPLSLLWRSVFFVSQCYLLYSRGCAFECLYIFRYYYIYIPSRQTLSSQQMSTRLQLKSPFCLVFQLVRLELVVTHIIAAFL